MNRMLSSARSNRPRTAGMAAGSLSILLSLLALLLFGRPAQSILAWLVYLGSTALFMLGCYLIFPAEHRPPQLGRKTIGWLIAILVLAAVIRFIDLDRLPFGTWYDEAENGLLANRILSEPHYQPIYRDSANFPSHFLNLLALAFKVFGSSTATLRMVTASFGVLTVLVAFWLGREAVSERFGLIFAFMFAVARWHITFSRIGLDGITTPFFILLSTYFLLRAWRTGRVHAFAWAGLSWGYGLCFYAGFRLYAIVVAIFMILWVRDQVRSNAQRPKVSSHIVTNLLVFAMIAGIVLAPLLQYVLQKPDRFFNRAGQVSIFNRRDESNLARALLSNTAKHLLAFNYRGDPNGRHNLPGAPMLDSLSGILFVLGLGLALSRMRETVFWIFVVSFFAGLMAGILSLDFEAPQMLRAIGAMPAVLFFVALAAEVIWRGLAGTASVAGRTGVIVLGLAIVIAYLNLYDHFDRQAKHGRVWEGHNAVETIIARRMMEAGPENTTFYVSMFHYNHMVIQFLAPDVRDSQLLATPDITPLREPGDQDIVLFIDKHNEWMVEEFLELYPNASYERHTNPSGTPILHVVSVAQNEVRQVQGVTVRYWRGQASGGAPDFVQDELAIHASWPHDAPFSAPFVAAWDTVFYVPDYDEYDLCLQTPADATLWLDGRIESEQERGQECIQLYLAEGNHALQIAARGAEGEVAIAWRHAAAADQEPAPIPPWLFYLSPPIEAQGLLGTFYNGEDWEGEIGLQRIDPNLDTYFHIIPLSRPYSAEWTGQLAAPVSGQYTLGLSGRGQAELYVDERSVLKSEGDNWNLEHQVELELGYHPLRVRYLDHLGNSELHLFWTMPNGRREIVPAGALRPFP